SRGSVPKCAVSPGHCRVCQEVEPGGLKLDGSKRYKLKLVWQLGWNFRYLNHSRRGECLWRELHCVLTSRHDDASPSGSDLFRSSAQGDRQSRSGPSGQSHFEDVLGLKLEINIPPTGASLSPFSRLQQNFAIQEHLPIRTLAATIVDRNPIVGI